MSGYEAVIETVRQAGQAASGASEAIAGVDAAGRLPTGESGMPGGRIVGKIDALRSAWQERTRSLSTGFSEVSGSLGQAAQLYSSNEQAAQTDLHHAASAGGRKAL
ncbi:hypothetical protein CFN78_11345 [Amycolatopsis antarctica]|uniref:ESX-1 secretion-associated protein n=1 Tax=Amycolatopsis antarctica TaxID=1854586 RepID=A0A263D7N8_9PSEU|nr:hypothetical protein [Amycolatopsis antarctica]OZM73415.1 hypothetical protein CFN78_11345 [Amycolatopsis antarctica]